MFSERTNWKLAPNRLAQALENFRRSGRELIDLTVSNPTTAGLGYASDRILTSLGDRRALTYRPEARGLLSARQAIARYYQSRNPTAPAPNPQDLVLTASTSEAYSFLARLLCDVGDEWLAPAPSYPLFDYLADLNDVQLLAYPLFYDHGWHLDAHALAARISPRSRAILLVHPNNPTGSYLAVEEIAALNQLANHHHLALIVDEVFLDYAHSPALPFSFTANREVLTFTLGGLSKMCGLPQMKLAWIATSGPEALAQAALARLEVIVDTYLSVNTAAQVAAPELLALAPSFQQQLLERIHANLRHLDSELRQQNLCGRLQTEAGWYALLRLPALASDEDFAISLLEAEGVLVHPGHFFDFPQDGFMVLSLITPPAVLAEGLRRLLAHLGRVAEPPRSGS